MQAALQSFSLDVINVDVKALGDLIQSQIEEVGLLHTLSSGDIKVHGSNGAQPPADVINAMKRGTKFFDAVLYFGMPVAQRPKVTAGQLVETAEATIIADTKRHLLWMAIFCMLRGSYPSSAGNSTGSDVPAFLRNICGMSMSPAELSSSLASFDLVNIPLSWIRQIQWSGMHASIRQRLALGLAGYRMLGPFRLYSPRPDASDDAIAAFNWIKAVTQAPADYAIMSCTRSPTLIGRLGSWNAALGNLMLECFTKEQIAEMVKHRLIFAAPVHDPRADTWRAWVAGGALVLNDPIGL